MRLWIWPLLGTALMAPRNAEAALEVDFGYSPPEWRTAICLPDDPCKSLVDRSGRLLYHYRNGGYRFDTRVRVQVAENAVWKNQSLHSPRVPVVRTLRSADGLEIAEEVFAVIGAGAPKAPSGSPPRNDLVLVRIANKTREDRTLAPRLVIWTTLDFAFRPEAQRVVVNKHETITASLRMTGLAEEKKARRVIQMEPLSIPAGKSATFFVLYSGGGSIVTEPRTVEQAVACRESAIAFWEKAALPYGRVEAPDAGIQALLDSSIRNIWQAREIKDGLPAFQVGPACYRGLWIVDGAFLLEAATMLGATGEARHGLAYELTHQQPDGSIKVMEDHSKENGIVIWTCVRHARLTRDKDWLRSVWPRLTRVAKHIRVLRRETLDNETRLDDGLIPPGFPDGGIDGVHAGYANPYWNLIGLRAFIEGARWLGKEKEAAAWQGEYAAFMSAFRKAARRDMAKDPRGNPYLPALMGAPGREELPQRGQWAFCHAVHPGRIFAGDDPLVCNMLAMLEATEREGMVYGTGWDPDGIWNYFASFYGHALLWQGEGRKAAECLYAFANHAAPVMVWCEEQPLRGDKFHQVGDMPHNWASAEFIRLVIHLLALDRGDELHLLEGFPREWAGPGMTTRLNGVNTPFGPLHLSVQVAPDGRTAALEVKPLAANCRAVVVHLPMGGTRKIPPQEGGRVDFRVTPESD